MLNKARVQALIQRSDVPLLLLAAAAVVCYLADLYGLWSALGAREAYSWASKAVDLVFAVDLALKLWALGPSYRRGPWFLIDLLSALPVLTLLARAPESLYSLRFLRMFRVFRLLRILRAIRVTRLLHTGGGSAEDDPQQVAFHRVVGVAVLVYSVVFLGLVYLERNHAPPGVVTELQGQALPQEFEVEVQTARDETLTLRLPPEELFGEADRNERLLVMGSVLTMILMMVFARYRMSSVWSRQVRALLNLALPVQVADYFMEHSDAYNHNVRMPATVIFCDIKGFTSSAERLAIEDLKSHLERVLDVVVAVHLKHDLIIDKFIGDAVMSFRGGNLVKGDAQDHAYRVVRAAVDSAREVEQLEDPHFTALKIGGASGESLLIGTFGTSKRLSYTILGDRVNLAARLESSCNALGVRNLFCDRTHDLNSGRRDLVWRRMGRLRVQGKTDDTQVFEVFDASEDLRWLSAFHEGLALYEQRRFSDAAARFDRANRERRGGDAPSRLYLHRSSRLAADPPDPDWQPILETTK